MYATVFAQRLPVLEDLRSKALRSRESLPGAGRGARKSARRARASWQSARVPHDTFDERIARGYEAKWPEIFEPAVVEPAVSFLADLAGTGSALELGVGTGRLALPLSRRGVRVHGIDISAAMVAELQRQPGADDIGVTSATSRPRQWTRRSRSRISCATRSRT